MEVAIEITIGAVIAVGIAYYWQSSSKQTQRKIHAFYLVLAAGIYVVFGLRAPNQNWLLLEISGFFIYGGVSLYGLKKSPIWLAYGWAGHVLWDCLLHWNETTATFVPHWYAPVCLGYDLIMAGYLGYTFVDYPL